MTNKEWYQKTFSLLHASERTMEAQLMKKTKRLTANRLVPVIAAHWYLPWAWHRLLMQQIWAAYGK